MFYDYLEKTRPRVHLTKVESQQGDYFVPAPILSVSRQYRIAIKRLVRAVDERPERSLSKRIRGELIAAASGKKNLAKELEAEQKLAANNKAFLHFRW